MDFFGFEKLSLVDFDGVVSATVFTGGCNFRCGFCHNSPLVLDYKQLNVVSEKEVIDYLKKRSGILEGLCISGGEPTLNKDLPNFCEKVKALGYKIKLDTNGTDLDAIKSLISNGLIDYVAMDIKNDFDHYGEIIGIKEFNPKTVIASKDFLLENSFPYEFRTTLIKEFHTEENVKKIAKEIKGANKYFLQKFKDSGACIQSHLSPVDENTVLKFVDILKEYIPYTYLRGYGI